MARTALTYGTISRAGLTPVTPVAGDVANGNSLANDGRTFFLLANTGSTVSRTLTIGLVGGADGQTIVPKTETLAFGTSQWFGPYPPEAYGGTLKLNVDNAELKFSCYRLASN